MDITEKLLTANGWEAWRMAEPNGKRTRWLEKRIRDDLILEVEISESMPVTLFFNGSDTDLPLPNVCTMEQLALLFALLGHDPDTSALKARLPATLVPVATPPGLRLRAGEREGGK